MALVRPEEQEEQLEAKRRELFADYNDAIGPLLVTAEVRLGSHPTGLLNEIRAFLDHIARSYHPDIDCGGQMHSLERAKSHLTRAQLDCYKAILVSARRRLRNFLRSYRGLPLGVVDGGAFLPRLLELRDKAEAELEEAKNKERLDGEHGKADTLELWETAVASYEDIREFISAHGEALTQAAEDLSQAGWVDPSMAPMELEDDPDLPDPDIQDLL